MLKYKCPRSGRVITTSIKTDTVTLLEMRNMKLSVWCTHCGTSHQIRATDAFLDEPLSQAAE
jgi:transcription elongation factor Elf1